MFQNHPKFLKNDTRKIIAGRISKMLVFPKNQRNLGIFEILAGQDFGKTHQITEKIMRAAPKKTLT